MLSDSGVLHGHANRPDIRKVRFMSRMLTLSSLPANPSNDHITLRNMGLWPELKRTPAEHVWGTELPPRYTQMAPRGLKQQEG